MKDAVPEPDMVSVFVMLFYVACCFVFCFSGKDFCLCSRFKKYEVVS